MEKPQTLVTNYFLSLGPWHSNTSTRGRRSGIEETTYMSMTDPSLQERNPLLTEAGTAPGNGFLFFKLGLTWGKQGAKGEHFRGSLLSEVYEGRIHSKLADFYLGLHQSLEILGNSRGERCPRDRSWAFCPFIIWEFQSVLIWVEIERTNLKFVSSIITTTPGKSELCSASHDINSRV